MLLCDENMVRNESMAFYKGFPLKKLVLRFVFFHFLCHLMVGKMIIGDALKKILPIPESYKMLI